MTACPSVLRLALLGSLVSTTLLVAPVPLVHAATLAPDENTPRAAVRVDASALGDAAAAVEEQVRVGARGIFDNNGLRTVDRPDAPQVVLTISALGGDKPGYRCDYEIRMDGQAVEGTKSFSDCRLCTESELVETAQAAIETQLPRLKALGAPPVAEPQGDPGPDPTTVPDDAGTKPVVAPPDNGKPRGLQTLGKAGIAVAVVGVAALVPGIVMAVLPPKPLANAQERTTTIPGAVLAGVGGAALITGVALIAVDAVRRKKQAKTAVAPTLAPGFAGLSLRGRF